MNKNKRGLIFFNSFIKHACVGFGNTYLETAIDKHNTTATIGMRSQRKNITNF